VAAQVPPPYRSRPATLGDVAAVAAILNANALACIGEPYTTAELLESEWRTPGRDLETTSAVVEAPDGSLAACAFLDGPPPHVEAFAIVDVADAHRGRGLDRALLQWAEAVAPALVADAPAGEETVLRVGAWVGEHELMALLEERGLAPVRHFWRMTVALDDPPPPPAWPDGIVVRPFRRGRDERAVYATLEEAFRDHWGADEEPFEAWLWDKVESPAADFDPDLWWLAVDGDELAAVLYGLPRARHAPDEGYLRALGVRRPWRRRGLARALLLQSFATFRARGTTVVSLHVDAANPTGALELYEGVGMTAQPRFEIWERPLARPAG
jgi:ribosomal protein S18 acetylase RimI-like enzyme